MRLLKKRHAALFLGPALGLLTLILFLPIVYSLNLSLYQADGASWFAGSSTFVALDNYWQLVRDGSFINAIVLLSIYIVVSTLVELGIALGLAIYFDQVVTVPKWVQTLILLPMFVLPVVSGLTFRYLFDPEGGILGHLYLLFNSEAPDMLGDPVLAFTVVVVQDVWRMWPFLFIIIFAGIKSIPRDPIEAIKLDGANLWQTCRYVIIPSLKHTILIAVVLKVIESLKAFTEIYVMTGGGPGESTTILSMYIVKQITQFAEFGLGSAASSLLLIFGVGLTIGLGFLQRRQHQEVL